MFVVGSDQFKSHGSYIYKQLLTGAKITLLCGAGISTAAGIPVSTRTKPPSPSVKPLRFQNPRKDFRSIDGLYSKKFRQNGLVLQGRDLFDISTMQNAEKLALFNQIMTDLRIKSRTTPTTTFHKFVSMLNRQGRLQRCYTQNFDGLEIRENPELETYIYNIHGTNTQLICRTCGQQPGASVKKFDKEFLESGLVQCPHCQQAGKSYPGCLAPQHVMQQSPLAADANRLNKRRRPIGYLTPNILMNQQPTTLSKNGMDIAESLDVDTHVDLLLIVGTSLATQGAYKLAKEMVHGVHQHGGIVIYIDRRQAGRKLAGLFDMQLQLDIEEWSRHAVIAAQEVYEVRTGIYHKELGVPNLTILTGRSCLWGEQLHEISGREISVSHLCILGLLILSMTDVSRDPDTAPSLKFATFRRLHSENA